MWYNRNIECSNFQLDHSVWLPAHVVQQMLSLRSTIERKLCEVSTNVLPHSIVLDGELWKRSSSTMMHYRPEFQAESVEQEPQKQLKRGKCGWLDAERDIGSVEVKVSGLNRCLHIGKVFPFHIESEVSRQARLPFGCQQSSSTAQKEHRGS